MTRNIDDFDDILKFRGLRFIKELLHFEERRFENNFIKYSVFEDINNNFGIFPMAKVYPAYFGGDITEPQGKIIFISINPGYNKESNKIEQDWIKNNGYFYTSCRIFEFFSTKNKGLIPFFARIAGFLKRLKKIKKIDWQWFQDNFINLEMIPYHSTNAAGLRINNLAYYRKTYFEIILKILNYLQPQEPIFINGFPTFEKYFTDPIFHDVVKFKKVNNIWKGTIKNHHFIGLPFLKFPRGGVDNLVKTVKKEL